MINHGALLLNHGQPWSIGNIPWSIVTPPEVQSLHDHVKNELVSVGC